MKIPVIITLLASAAFAQDPVQITPLQVMDTRTGVAIPCVGCSIYTYLQGTNVPLATYTDHTLGTPNTNPVITNSSGYAAGGDGSTITGIWVGFSCYKFTLKDANSVTIWTQDSICDQALLLKALLAGSTGALQVGYEPTGGTVVTTVGAALNSAFIYDVGFSSATAACASSITVAVTKQSIWTGLSSLTCSAPLWFPTGSGVSIKPASGQTVSFKATAGLHQICDISSGGNCVITSENTLIYPEWWGAVAGQDSTAAYQAALNTVSGTANALHIQIPNNSGVCYWISTALTHDGTNGSVLDIEGVVNTFGARLGSCLEWHGSSGGALTHFSNEFNPTFRHFGVRGNALAKQLLWLDTSNNSFNTQSVHIEDVSFAGMAGADSAGLQLSNAACTNNNVSGVDVLNSQFIGTGVTGLDTGIRYFCGGNSKNLTVHGAASRMTNLGWGVQAVNGGWMEFDSVYFGANLVEDFQMDVGHLIIRACDSEGSAKMVTMGSGSVRSSLTITDGYVFASGIVASDDIIATLDGTSLFISSSDFYNNRTGSSVAKIVLSSGFDPYGCTGTGCGSDALVSLNNFYQNATDAAGVFFDAASSPLCVNRGTYYAANANQVPCLSMGDHGGGVGTQVLLTPYSPFNPRVYVPFNGPSTICLPPEITYDSSANLYLCVAANTWAAIGRVASYIATEVGSNNAIAGTPTFPTTLAAGLQMKIKLAHSLQAGTNTFAYSGGSAVAIKSSRNPANDIGTAYVSGGFINLTYTGSVWVDGSQ